MGGIPNIRRQSVFSMDDDLVLPPFHEELLDLEQIVRALQSALHRIEGIPAKPDIGYFQRDDRAKIGKPGLLHAGRRHDLRGGDVCAELFDLAVFKAHVARGNIQVQINLRVLDLDFAGHLRGTGQMLRQARRRPLQIQRGCREFERGWRPAEFFYVCRQLGRSMDFKAIVPRRLGRFESGAAIARGNAHVTTVEGHALTLKLIELGGGVSRPGSGRVHQSVAIKGEVLDFAGNRSFGQGCVLINGGGIDVFRDQVNLGVEPGCRLAEEKRTGELAAANCGLETQRQGSLLDPRSVDVQKVDAIVPQFDLADCGILVCV